MGISLEYITFKLALNPGEYKLHLRQKDFYDNILFFSKNVDITKSRTIFFCNDIKNIPTLNNPSYGFIIFSSVPTDNPISNSDFNYLQILKNDICEFDLFNQISAILSEAVEIINRFKEYVCEHKSLQDIIELICETLGNPAYLVDSSFKVLAIDRRYEMRELSATWKRLEDEGYLSLDLVDNLIRSNELNEIESGTFADIIKSKFFYTSFINYNLRNNGQIQGHLFVVGMIRKITPADLELCTQIGKYVSLAMVNNPKYQSQRGCYYEHFIKDMLDGNLTNKEHIDQQMQFLHFTKQSKYIIIKITSQNNTEIQNERLVSQLEIYLNMKPVLYSDYVIAINNISTHIFNKTLVSNLHNISKTYNCKIGISDIFSGYYYLDTYYKQASMALELGAKYYPESKILYYKDIALQHILTEFSNNNNCYTFIHPELLILKKYDEQHNSDLIDTLYEYLINERNVIQTAQKLHIHRNTLAYRINKIDDICEVNLNDYIERQRIIFCIEILLKIIKI